MKQKDEHFLLRVADLYYYQNLSQDVIATKLNVSRATISRALSLAKKEGYVKVMIDFPSDSLIDIEKELEEKYHIQEVSVTHNNPEKDVIEEVSNVAARYLARILKHDMVFGLTWGTTMKFMVDAFERQKLGKSLKVKGVKVVPFLGNNAPANEEYDFLRLTYSSLLTSKLAELVRGIAYSLPAPMYVKSLELKKLLLQEPEITRTLEKAKECQAAFFSVGDLSDCSAISSLSDTMANSLLNLRKQGGVGETLGRVFNCDGEAIKSEFDEHLIGLSLEDLKKIPTKVCIVYDEYKLEATKAALKGGLIDVLILDELCAKKLL